jgi:hypothetical protein
MSSVSEVADLLDGIERATGASPLDVTTLEAAAPWLPREYVICLSVADGAEGFIHGRGYFRLWSTRDALRFNSAYQIPLFLPSAFMIGTDAAALGYFFDRRYPEAVYSVELAALHEEYAERVGDSFVAFLRRLAEDDSFAPQPVGQWGPPAHIRGHVLHEKQPVALGGSASDPNNRVLVPVEKHPELIVFWARALRSVKARVTSPEH